MNREIKFRAWHLKANNWVMKCDIPKCFVEQTDCTMFVSENHIKLMQYIGRKDRRGREIFEGYIVELRGEYLNNYWDVVWNEKSAGFEFVIRGMQYDTEYISNFKDEDIIIVGNIYQNANEFKN